MGIFDWIGTAVSDVGDAVGLGEKKVSSYDTDKNAFYDETRSNQRREQIANRLGQIQSRAAPTSQSAKIDNVRELGMNRIADNERMQAANVKQAKDVQPMQMNDAQQISGANINRLEDRQARGVQMNLVNDLQQQAAGKGPSLATEQLKANREETLKAQMAATAASGGNAALARRNMSMASMMSQQQLGRDSAMSRIQEQNAARAQLGDVSANMRNQDASIAANQAQLNQQANMSNQDAMNNLNVQRAQFDLQANLANQNSTNSAYQLSAQMQQAANAQNALEANKRNMSQAEYNQRINELNQKAVNERTMQQSAYDQQTNLANQQASLANRGLNDEQERYYAESRLGIDAQDRQSKQNYESMKTNENAKMQDLESSNSEAASSRRAGFVKGLMSISDEDAKTNVTKSKIETTKFLDQLSSVMNGPTKGARISSEQAKNYESIGEAMGKFMSRNKAVNPLETKPQQQASEPSTNPFRGWNKIQGSNPSGGGEGGQGILAPAPHAVHGPGISPAQSSIDAAELADANAFHADPSMAAAPLTPDVSAVGAMGAAAAVSDEKEKNNIGPARKKISEFLNDSNLDAYKYNYKEPSKPGRGKGEYVSLMAQDLEKTELGKSMVKNTKDGKIVDYGKALGTILASQIVLNDRLNKLEKSKK